MYSDPERLRSVLTDLESQFGPALFRDPQRTRNLMVDEYGTHGIAARSDIDMMVSALSNDGFDQMTQFDVAPATAADRLAASSGLSGDDACWTVEMLRSIVAGGAQPVNLGQPLPPPSAAFTPPTELGAIADLPPAQVRRGWPVSAKVAVIAALVVAALGIVTAIVGRSDAADADASNAPAASAAPTTAASAGAADVGELQAQVTADEAKIAELEAQLTAAQSAGGSAAQVTDLQAQLTAVNATLTDTQNQLAVAQQAATDANAERDAANAALAGAQAPFGVGYGGITVPTQELAFNGAPTTCDGFTETYHCTAYTSFTGYVRQQDGAVVVEVPNAALVPMTTDDGLTWYGTAEASQTGFTCDGVPAASSTVKLNMTPQTFSADPTTKQIVATSYAATLSIEITKWKCRPAIETYSGTVTFFGLS